MLIYNNQSFALSWLATKKFISENTQKYAMIAALALAVMGIIAAAYYFVRKVLQPDEKTVKLAKLNASIAKIDAFVAQGKKVCLFIGRVPSEKLPLETGEATPDEVWISGDIEDCGAHLNKERVYVCLDFNQDEFVNKLQKKFDLIVIDTSVIKFFQNDFAKRFSVMLRTPTSKMIFEASTGQAQTHYDEQPDFKFIPQRYEVSVSQAYQLDLLNKKEEHYQQFRENAPLTEQQEVWEQFIAEEWDLVYEKKEQIPQNLPKVLPPDVYTQFMHFVADKDGIGQYDEITQFGHEALEAHLKTIFQHVIFHPDQPYPYQHRSGSGIRPYFIVGEPIQFQTA